MKADFTANKTMRTLGRTYPITADTEYGRAIVELLEGLNLPRTGDLLMLVQYAMSLGIVYGKREERKATKERQQAKKGA